MKVRILLTTLLLALLSTSAIYAHDCDKGSSCCKDKCTSHRHYADDCDFCNMFRGWGGWRHCAMYHHDDACCSKEVKKEESTVKHCEGECEHSWRSHRAYWRHQHYYHHDDSKDSEDRG